MKISFYAEVEFPVDERFSRTISATVTLEGEAIIELAKAISAAQHSVQSDGAFTSAQILKVLDVSKEQRKRSLKRTPRR